MSLQCDYKSKRDLVVHCVISLFTVVGEMSMSGQ